MKSENYSEVIKRIMRKGEQGFRLSELRGLDLAVANNLINKGKLYAIRLKNDWLVNKP